MADFPLSAAECAELARLLRRVGQSGCGVPRLPKEVFVALKGVCAQVAVEVLVLRDGEVLLTERHDQHWSGWHIPGGFVGCEESLESACDRIARTELGRPARLVTLLGSYTWRDHPYASLTSLLCRCELVGEPAEGKFFGRLPSDLIPEHRELLGAAGFA